LIFFIFSDVLLIPKLQDHKPDLASERERIERTGGNVQEVSSLMWSPASQSTHSATTALGMHQINSNQFKSYHHHDSS
jgi:hypothetical protein